MQREPHVKQGTDGTTDTDSNKYETILCDRKMALLNENHRERFKDCEIVRNVCCLAINRYSRP